MSKEKKITSPELKAKQLMDEELKLVVAGHGDDFDDLDDFHGDGDLDRNHGDPGSEDTATLNSDKNVNTGPMP